MQLTSHNISTLPHNFGTYYWCTTRPIIGGESILIGSIFDVYSCQKTPKIGTIWLFWSYNLCLVEKIPNNWDIH